MDPATELTDAEILAVKSFRDRIRDLLPELSDFAKHDLGLIRFLRARDLNLDKAESMFRKHIQWKKDNQMDYIMTYQLEPVFEEHFKFKVCGLDKNGRIAAFAPVGKWNVAKTINDGMKDQIMTFGKQGFEVPLLVGSKLSSPTCYISQVHGIIDFEGFSLSNYMSTEVIGLVREYIQLLEANYPENLGCAIVINAPKIFEIFWAVVKPWLAPRTLQKIHGIYGSNKETWKKVLLEHIDPDCLPSEYGGAITNCLPFTFSHGIDKAIPKFIIHPEKDMSTIFIQAGQKYRVELDMKSGSKISWNFRSEDWDIGFRVDFDDDTVIQEVIKASRVDSHRFTQKGLISCENSGKYIISFDNSHSKFRGKTVRYVVRTYDENEFSIELLSQLSIKYSVL